MRKYQKLHVHLSMLKDKWNEKNYKENIPFISVGLVSGLVCCTYAILFSEVEKHSQNFLQNYPNAVFVISPLFLIISFLLVRVFAPGSFGSGIPQVITSIENGRSGIVGKFLGIRVIFIKILSSLLAVFGGAAIGREGPSLQISAAVGYNIGHWFEKIGIKIKSEQLIIAGAASGLAAAFNTPVGGIVYAVEELTQDHIRSYKTVLLMSVLISGFTAQLFLGNYLYLGYPRILGKLGVGTFFAVTFVSLASGFLGAAFSKILIRLISWRKKQNLRNQILVVFLIGIALSFGYYFGGTKSIYSGKESINLVLFNMEALEFSDFGFRFLTPLLSSMSGVAGGIFAPSLSAGATFGGVIAQFFDPSMRTLLGLAGMIGFLTGVTHTPITSFVLVLEMTDRHSAVFPMMLAAVFSSIGARILGDKSFYEESAAQIKLESGAR